MATTLPGYELTSTNSMFAPAGTSPKIVYRLNQEIVRFVSTSEAKEKFLSAGSEVVGNSPDELATAMRAEVVRLGKVIKEAGIAAQ